MLEWSFKRTSRVFFFPDQHLGRNTALTMGITDRANAGVGSVSTKNSAATPNEQLRNSRVILWKGHCSVHQMFTQQHVETFRAQHSGHSRSSFILNARKRSTTSPTAAARPARSSSTVQKAPAGTKWAIGTELHLVNRLKQEHPEQEIHFLSPVVCMCATMYRIDLAHLCWSLENLAAGTPVNVIEVDDDTAHWSLVSLERMLEVK